MNNLNNFRSKGFIPLIFIIIVAVLTAAGGGYLVLKKVQERSFSPAPQEQESEAVLPEDSKPTTTSDILKKENIPEKETVAPPPAAKPPLAPTPAAIPPPAPVPVTTPAQPKPPDTSAIQGLWQPKIQIIWDQLNGEFREVPFSDENYHAYLEFKGNEICIGGTFDAAGLPAPCPRYVAATIQANLITVSQEGGGSALRWQVKDGQLELTETDGLDKMTLVKPTLPLGPDAPFSYTVKSAQDPKLLFGIWKIERAFEKGSAGFAESKPLARSLGYQEFKESNAMCRSWSPDFTKCNNYQPYTIVEGNKIKAARTYTGSYDWYIWKIVDGKLDLTSEFSRGIYKKIPALEGPIINYNPATIPKIDSIGVTPLSVSAGSEITITCKASDNVEVSWIDFTIDGGGMGHVWRFNPENKLQKTLTANYTYKLSNKDTYQVSCQATDDEEVDSKTETLSVVAN